MPKLAPFILLATFLTHDNNFHLYLSRECEKRALHHRARVPRGCRISRPGGLGPHLRSGGSPARRALPLPPGMPGPHRPRGPGGAPGQGKAGNEAAPFARRRRLCGRVGEAGGGEGRGGCV